MSTCCIISPCHIFVLLIFHLRNSTQIVKLIFWSKNRTYKKERGIKMEKADNVKIKEFLEGVSKIVGNRIGEIYSSAKGRTYFIQAPKIGSPMLLKHYDGRLFIDINPLDYYKIASGKISPMDYISTAKWLIGYYWGGASMVDGAYYQPFDIVGRQEEVRCYFKNLSCSKNGSKVENTSIEEQCKNCIAQNCMFKETKIDPRIELFKAICERFEREFPGYKISKFFCIRTNCSEIRLRANKSRYDGEQFSFTAYFSDIVIHELLMHEIEPKDWKEYANRFNFFVVQRFDTKLVKATMENVEKAFQ